MVHLTFWISSYTNEIVEKSSQQQFEGNEIMSCLKSSTHQIAELHLACQHYDHNLLKIENFQNKEWHYHHHNVAMK